MCTLRAENLCKSFRRRQVVRNVSLAVASGEIIGLLGPNGAGKSTSFNIVAGLLPPDAGRVRLGSHNLDALPLYRRARLGLGYLPQESTVFRGLTVRQNLETIYEAQGIDRITRRDQITALIQRYNLGHVEHNIGAHLSGGERRRLEMARCLITQPKILLLDEPFAGVDPIAVSEIKRFIQSVAARGIGVLLTDHNVRETLGICHRAYLISEGTIMLAGSPQEIVADPVARETYLGRHFTL